MCSGPGPLIFVSTGELFRCEITNYSLITTDASPRVERDGTGDSGC